MNKEIRVSIILPMYKDIVALELILNALKEQTYLNFEVVVAEDDDTEETKSFLEQYQSDFLIKHLFQEDHGNRKATAVNKALNICEGEYIIFIDGDTIPFKTFIESHVQLSDKDTVLCGRRVNLGEKVSNDLRKKIKTSSDLENHYFKNYFYLNNDNLRHYEQGLRFSPNSLIHNIISKQDKNIHIVGSNFSCFKKNIFLINGFDEDIIGGSKDDVDLEWRFIMSGCHLKSAKFCANLFHLDHARNSRTDDEKIARQQMERNKDNKQYICPNGIKKSE